MDTKSCSVLRTFRHQDIHLICPADSLSDVCIIRMCGVMSLICISFQQYRLSKSVCVHCYTFYIVKRCKEWILSLSSKVHGYTIRNKLRNFFALEWVIHNAAVCNCTVLPVNLFVIIHIVCNDDLCLRHRSFLYHIASSAGIRDYSVIIPFTARKSYGFSVPGILCRRHNSCIVGTAGCYGIYHTSLILRVAPKSCTQFVIRNKCIHIILV